MLTIPACTCGRRDPDLSEAEIEQASSEGRLLCLDIELDGSIDDLRWELQKKPKENRPLTDAERAGVIRQAAAMGLRKIVLIASAESRVDSIQDAVSAAAACSLGCEIDAPATICTRLLESPQSNLQSVTLRIRLSADASAADAADRLDRSIGSFKQSCRVALELPGAPDAARITEIAAAFASRRFEVMIDAVGPYESADEARAAEQSLTAAGSHIYRATAGAGAGRFSYSCTLTATGQIIPCRDMRIPVGDIRARGLREIIADCEMIEDIREIGRLIKGPCRTCEQAPTCTGCRGRAYSMTGDHLGSDSSCWRNADARGEILTLPTEAESLIPHRPPMRIVDRLERITERTAEASVTIPAGSPFVDGDGFLDPSAYVEMMAQAMAAMNGLKYYGLVSRLEGFLLGAQNVRSTARARVGDRLSIVVHKATRLGDFAIVEGTVRCAGELLATGQIKIWHNSEAERRIGRES